MPGHQSDRWYGSARNRQTSSTDARRTRSAAYRGKELLSTQHALDLGLAFVLAEPVDTGVRRVARDLLDAEVPVCDGRDLRQVRDGDDLRALGQTPEHASDGIRRLPADAGVDLVEDECLAARDGGDRERDARELPTGRRLGDGGEREAGVGTDEEDGLVGAGGARVALPQLAHELALPHADVVQLGRDRIGERRR